MIQLTVFEKIGASRWLIHKRKGFGGDSFSSCSRSLSLFPSLEDGFRDASMFGNLMLSTELCPHFHRTNQGSGVLEVGAVLRFAWCPKVAVPLLNDVCGAAVATEGQGHVRISTTTRIRCTWVD